MRHLVFQSRVVGEKRVLRRLVEKKKFIQVPVCCVHSIPEAVRQCLLLQQCITDSVR